MTNLFIPLNNIIKKLLIPVFLFFTLLLSTRAFAQTVGNSQLSCDISNRNPCTSKDLEIVSVAIDAPACTSCTPGQTVTFPLKMTIHNGTKSERTSFALYGSLSSGASIGGKTGNVFLCVGPITVKSDQLLPGETAPGNQTFAVGTISFVCGQDLTLSNNFLAWTDAAGETVPRCSTFLAATKCSDIAPKCGTSPSITIVGPVGPPTLGKVDPTCTVSTGKVTVTSNTTGFTFSLDNSATFTAYPTGGWTVNPGEHCVRAKRTSDGCISTATCITIPPQPANPDRPVVTIQEATICGTNATPSVTVCSPIAGTYTLKQTGEADKTLTYPTTATIKFNVKPGLSGFTLTVTNSAGCTSQAATCTNGVVTSCPQTTQSRAITTTTVKPQTSVLAAPNPFNDRVKFTLKSTVSGKGSLELYNLLGQRVKTVYQGYIEKGQAQTIDYNVPNAQRTNLIYLFRVGDQKTTGKLVGLK